MKWLALVVAVGVVLAGCGGAGDGVSGSATCAAPYIDTRSSVDVGAASTESPRLTAGETTTFYGHAYFSDCYDTGQRGTPPPISTVVLVVEFPGGARTQLDPVHPDVNGTFSVDVAIPADTGAGTLRIFSDAGNGAVGPGTPFTVVAGSEDSSAR